MQTSTYRSRQRLLNNLGVKHQHGGDIASGTDPVNLEQGGRLAAAQSLQKHARRQAVAEKYSGINIIECVTDR